MMTKGTDYQPRLVAKFTHITPAGFTILLKLALMFAETGLASVHTPI